MAQASVTEGRNVTMYPEDWQIIAIEAAHDGSNVSAALRRIVREWHKWRPYHVSMTPMKTASAVNGPDFAPT